MMRFLKEKEKEKEKEKDKDKDKDKDKEKDKEKEKEKEHKEQAKKDRKEEKEREKLEKKREKEKEKENGKAKELDMTAVDWRGAKTNLKNRRSNSFSVAEPKKAVSSPSKLRNTYGRNSMSLMDLHEGAIKAKKEGKVVVDGRTTKQKLKEKAFLESIAQQSHAQEKPSAFAIASESYKLRIIELEEEVVIANKRVVSLTDRVHMLEAEIRAAHEHHTRQNATLQEKLANVETANALLKNSLETKKQKSRELKAKLELADFALQQTQEDGEKDKSADQLENAEKGASTVAKENGYGDKEKEVRLPASTSSGKFSSLTPAIIKSLGLVQNQDKAVESVLNQRAQVLEAELSTKTNDLAVLKLLISTLEPQVKTLTQDLSKAKQDATDNGEQVSYVVEILGEWQTAMEAHDVELREHLEDESEVPTDEEIRRLNKKVLLLRERVGVVDQIIDRIAKTVGVNSTRFDIGVVTSTKNTPSKDISLLSLNPSRPAIRSNTLNERDAALVLKLAVLTLGTEPAVQKLVKGILLNTVRSVNLGGLTLLPETIQALSKALLVSSTVLSVLFPNTHLGDAGVVLLADAMRGNSSITNLNLEECGVGDTGVKALTQALAANKKTALVSLNLSHNTIGELGSQSLATYLEATQTLTCLNLGYSHLGAASAPFISQALRHAHITHLFLPGNDFQDEGASKFAYALNTNTHLQVFNFQSNGVTDKGASKLAEALSHCHIHTLDLSRNPIGPQGAKALADSLKFSNTHLKELSLISSTIQTQGAFHLADALEHNTTLTTLHLWGNKIGSEGLAAFSPENRLGGVKYLDLRGNELPPSSGQEVAAILSKKSSLSFLDLTGNQLGAKGCELISRSLASATLTSLSLSANSMGNEGVMYIARSLGPALTTLSLSLNFLGDDAIDYLAPRLLSPCNITHLDLSWNHIGSGGARELSKVLEQHTCTITTLNLEGNSLGPEGTVLLMAALHNNTTLTHLILATNNFRKDGAKAVADLLKRSPTITTLNIGKNGIKDEGALAIADALKTNVSVTNLDLSENRIENTGIHSLSEALKLNSSLLSINLSHNPFDRSAVQSLSQAHARNLKVHVIIHSM